MRKKDSHIKYNFIKLNKFSKFLLLADLIVLIAVGYRFMPEPAPPEQKSFLAVTVLKQQYLKAPDKPKEETGGVADLPKEDKIVETITEVPNWTPTLPLVCLRITQNYWWQHRALDLGKCKNTENIDIMAIDDGEVVFSGRMGGYGNRIDILHPNGYKSTYSHLSELWYEKGDILKGGDVIGLMGSTGNSTGRHLHFEIIDPNGNKINPSFIKRIY